jgi:hypothetical protein
MQEVKAGEDIPLGADAVWRVIGDFSGIRKWAPAVQSETTEVTPKGKVRSLTMPNGRTIQELCTEETPTSYTYTLDRPDMTAYFSTVAVKAGGDNSSRIELMVRYTPKDPNAGAELEGQLAKFLQGNLKAMKRALGVG